ncbi:hypothetical protein AB0I55_29345 [Actinocatenispora sera]|uniref:hypothetical protein n=1 Tax=Actinocatenispora sera TaxID=390989 RepID=UPI0033EF6D75
MADRLHYLGPHDALRLDLACRPLVEAFGTAPVLVGSALARPDYRDVDVRLVVSDDRYRELFGGSELLARLISCALSDWLGRASGLPVDFQVRSAAAAAAYTGPSVPLGTRTYAAVRWTDSDR